MKLLVLLFVFSAIAFFIPTKAQGVSIAPFKGDKKAAISFTYDDGMLCHYTDVAPELEKRGFRGTFWIIGENMGKNEPDYPWMTWEQVAELSQRGHEISNHTWTHPYLTELDNDALAHEIFRCDSAVEATTGKRPITFCYPYNAMNDKVIKAASANRVGTRTFQDGHGQKESKCTKESLMAWLNNTIDEKKWSVTMTHGITYGWDMWEDPTVLWWLYDQVKARESEVWVGTFAEVSAYVEEKAKTTLSARKWRRRLSVRPTMKLDERIFRQPLTMRVDGDFAGKEVKARQGIHSLSVVNNGDHVLVDFDPSGRRVIIKTK